MKTCYKCKETKPFEEFNKNKGRKDGLGNYCRECMKIIRKTHYQSNKKELIKKSAGRRQMLRDKLWAFKQGKVCADCPQSDPRTFEFDHLRNKEFNISEMVIKGMSWIKIEEEIKKCEIVCANCHRIRTYERGGWVRNIAIHGDEMLR